MAHDVFISYAKENQDLADSIRDRLEANKVSCWIASREQKRRPGSNWPKQIAHAIKESEVVVFLLSRHSNRSRYVEMELRSAIDNGLDIITFRTEDVQPSESIEFLVGNLQWLDAFPTYSEEHNLRLVEAIGRLLLRGSHKRIKEYEQELQTIENKLLHHKWAFCISGCLGQFEKSLTQLLKGLYVSLPANENRTEILAIGEALDEQEVLSFDELGLASLVSIYRNANIFSELRKQLTSSLQTVKEVDWEHVLAILKATQQKKRVSSRQTDAEMMFQWLKILLYDCELVGEHRNVPTIPEEDPALQECLGCGHSLQRTWHYCPICGISVILICEKCRRRLEPDYKRCPYCEEPVHRRAGRPLSGKERALDEYRILCKGAYLDDIVNKQERRLLEQKRLELGLSIEESEGIERDCAPRSIWEFTRLVQGALVDYKISEREKEFLESKRCDLAIDSDNAKTIIDVEFTRRKGELFQ